MSAAIFILLVEDSPTDVLRIEEAISNNGFHIQHSHRLEDALKLVSAQRFDVILLDLGLPDSQGMDTLRTLRTTVPQIPIVVLTGKDDEELALQSLKEGAQDYLVKGQIPGGSLRRVIRYAVERTGAEKKLRKSEERLRELTTHIHQVLWMIDAGQAKALYVGPAYETMWGRSCQSLADERSFYMEGIHPLDLEMMRREDAALYRTGHIDVECRVLRPDGSVRWVWIRGYPVAEQGQIVRIVGVVEDITARKSLEEQFRQSQKMEAVGRLAAGVAHDFNNLLTIIMGFSDLFLLKMPQSDPGREAMAQIRSAAARAAALTRQLLAFGRQQVLAPVVLDLNSLLSEIEQMLRRLIGADIEMTTIFQAGLGHVKVDPGQVEQIIINLVVNAADAMPEGGRLTIQTTNTVLSDSQSRRHAELPSGPYTLLAVSDTGSGMDEATKSRIFEPFFTTKKVGEGTGLGLATVFGIIKQSGGFIEVDSEPGAGSTFRTYLPQILEAARSNEPNRSPATMPRGMETILLVEDEDGLRDLARLVLETSGYKVLSTRNGVEAMKVCYEYPDVIQLLFTDVVMPSMGGRQLTDLLLPSRPDMKVLHMSGYTDDTVARHGLQSMNSNFLAKPFTPVALAKKVREVLDGTIEQHNTPVPGSLIHPASPVCAS